MPDMCPPPGCRLSTQARYHARSGAKCRKPIAAGGVRSLLPETRRAARGFHRHRICDDHEWSPRKHGLSAAEKWRPVVTRNAVLFAAFIVGQTLASPTFAQTAVTHDWTHGTTLTGQTGAAAAPSADTRATFGGGFGWTINHWTSIEASGV